MYNLVLVDDEDWILSGLQNAVEWESIGFTVTGAYGNGKDALAAMRIHPPDAMLTDIKMPIQDGISLVKELRKEGFHELEVVFLSGYDDFELAQSSLRLGAVDYVLKPSAPEQIMEVFERVRERLDKKRKEAQERQTARELVQSGIKIFKETVFNCLMYGNDSLYEKMMSLFADMVERERGKPFVVASAALRNTVEEGMPCETEREEIHCLKEHVRRIKRESGDCLNVIENRFSCSFVFSDKNWQDAEGIMEELKRQVRRETGKEMVHAQSDVLREVPMVKDAYESSLGRLYRLDMPAAARHLYLTLCNDRVLKAALEDRDQQIILWSLKHQMAQIEKTEPEFQLRLMKRLVYSMSMYCIQHQISARTIRRLYEPFEKGSYEAVKEGIISFVQSEFLKEKEGGGRNANLCKEVAKYISKNYSDDITLNDLAERFYLSPNYLGTLFKRNLGMGIKEYQTTIRLEQADSLIAGGKFKLYQVAEMVGYPNYEYFRKIYYKYRGKNPSE